jgi:hypothetical protein
MFLNVSELTSARGAHQNPKNVLRSYPRYPIMKNVCYSGVPGSLARSKVREFRHNVERRDPLRQPLCDEVDSVERAVP